MQAGTDRRNTYLGLAVMWLVGGSIYPFLSQVAEKVDPLNIIFIRSIGAALILFIAVLIMQPRAFALIRFDKSLIPIVIASLLFSPICSGALAWSSERVPGAVSALMYSTLPAMSTIYLFLRGRRPTIAAFAGVLLASAAVVFLIGAPQGPIQTSGVIAALISVFAWFAATEIWIKFETGYPLILAIFLQVAIGALGTWIIRLFTNPPQVSAAEVFDPNMIFLVAALASQYWAYLGISRRVSPALLTSFAFVNPVVAGAIGYFAFDQNVTTVQIFAGVTILIGVFLVVREDLLSKQ